jgi:phage shock protein C
MDMKKLYRSRKDRKIAGICGGLAEYFHIDATIIRLAAVFLCFITGIAPLILVYLISWIIIPEK